MQTIELFCGTKSFSKIAARYGHQTITTDVLSEFQPDILSDVLGLRNDLQNFSDGFGRTIGPVDILWASPPCEGFSVASIGRNWHHDHTPKTDSARLGLQLLQKTMSIIDATQPKWWFIENPRGKMRKIPRFIGWLEAKGAIRHTVSYCQYGDTRMKPTDIWTNATWWQPKPICKNGDPCHEAAPRGAKTGTQGIKGYTERSRIPPALFEDIFAQMPQQLLIAA
jgi:hypothetical protein